MVIVQPELFFELLSKNKANSLRVIEMTENQKLKIKLFYQHLLKRYFPFDALCWALAELQLLFERGSKKYSEIEVIKRAEKIIDSEIDYDTLCWFISSLKTYLEEIRLYP